MITIIQLLKKSAYELKDICDNPQLEAEILLAYALKKPRSYIYAWPDEVLPDKTEQLFSSYLKRRLNREPIAYITGTKEFWSLELEVSGDTLIPRPETELLVSLILEKFPHDQPIVAADLGTGSGAIAVALAKECPKWHLYAVDINENALQIARNNAQKFTQNNISFYHGNWCTPLPRTDFDVIVSNPPYIAENEWEQYANELAFEPKAALISGQDGLSAIREISQEALSYLKPGGFFFIEHGFLQGAQVREIFARTGYHAVYSARDLAGQERVTVGRL